MTGDRRGFLLFSLKSCLTFFVIRFILISYELLVNSWNFFMKRFESVSFLGQYGISAKTNGFGTSKKSGGIMKSSWVLPLHFSLNCLMALFTNLGG